MNSWRERAIKAETALAAAEARAEAAEQRVFDLSATDLFLEQHVVALEAQLAQARAALDACAERLETAEWNLNQCDHDCNDWNRALSRLAEAKAIIGAALAEQEGTNEPDPASLLAVREAQVATFPKCPNCGYNGPPAGSVLAEQEGRG